jgi:starch synthase
MKILLVSSEVVPFAKTGGLADVAGALPLELEKLGHEVAVVLPGYQGVDQAAADAGLTIQPTSEQFEIPIGNQLETGSLQFTKFPDSNTRFFFVQHEHYFQRDGLYGEGGRDYFDNCERFTFFSRAALETIRIFDLQTELVHANDWQTGLIPALLFAEHRDNPIYEQVASLFTIHNLAYQGLFDYRHMASTGLDPKYFNWQQMEFYGQLNLLKTGIVFADSINTVSPTYAEEIQSSEQGCGLDSILRHRADRLSGIINGIDTAVWNPTTDPFIPHHFDDQFAVDEGSAGKAACKASLQQEAQLKSRPDVPVIGIVGRLATQKGWSLIIPVLKDWLANHDAQWIILGTGEPDYHAVLTSLHQTHPDKLSVTLDFSNPFAHRIEAGADLFLMPSHYEPCGLNQMYSMAYGTVPVVRRTGGLADTVIDANSETVANQTATGFSFDDFTAEALNTALHRAVEMYRQQRSSWNQIMLNGMRRDWSWAASAKAYESLYQRTVGYLLDRRIERS